LDASAGLSSNTSPRDAVRQLQKRVNELVIGQERVVERLVIALIASGNVFVEGLPGLAKTRGEESFGQSRVRLQPHPVHP
jgi:MoxR-like ATPase